MTLYINQLQQTIVAFQVHEKWKGRIDQWQPKRKQRRPPRRNTKRPKKKTKRGTQKASPKFLRVRLPQLLSSQTLSSSQTTGVIPSNARDLGFSRGRQRPRFLVAPLLGMTGR